MLYCNCFIVGNVMWLICRLFIRVWGGKREPLCSELCLIFQGERIGKCNVLKEKKTVPSMPYALLICIILLQYFWRHWLATKFRCSHEIALKDNYFYQLNPLVFFFLLGYICSFYFVYMNYIILNVSGFGHGILV